MRLLFKNVTIVDGTGVRRGKVMTEDGKIRKVYKERGRVQTDYDREIDGAGKVLMPGFIDMHCHLRDPGLTYKEDLSTGLHAAAKGGFTTVCPMANTKPVMDTAEKVADNMKRGNALGLTEMIQVSAVTKDFSNFTFDLVDFGALSKVTPIFSNDGHNVDNPDVMRAAFKASAETGAVIATHNEPETETVVRDIEILKDYPGAKLHICHISKKATLDAIVAGKKQGLDITCEVTPHHVYASGLSYRVHPPFRAWADRKALLEGALSGAIDCCGTDHAPHSDEDKLKGSPGINNFETAFAMYHTAFAAAGMDLVRLSQMMSQKPAERLGLKNGLIAETYPADLVLVDPDLEWQVDSSQFVSKSHNTPFDAKWLKGQVLLTVKGGRIIYDHGSFV
ncbi:dihydroorotase [Pseudoramibacter porci]|uniref:Dihydroorotase n=1 Tax=Pseudoramibacter porci TaxID=2606631 RepID=A0A7X2NF35_9FIRM|nr:dihydroorotase [Pseudoramibacter porci]MSS19456.1 dihydroorotase [Pseudoramibacter porci]